MKITFKTLRHSANLSAEYVSEKLKITESAYRKYERSARIPKGESLLELKKIYNCTELELFAALEYHVSTKVS
ncbi:XRE family transcriptional regulator [Clostridium botulinum]|uniref:XRE family transcriptional regulator n=1 Tax=Clostridium botulinum TaxID=1491 RepID=A0A6M0SSM3_CLOBO|nr:helix-turn-helix transcriptional regulator [Clostridium botulinum]MBY6860775.1 helix-turn-helix transcriptional regulator [Clostridium botulinum]MBY7043836.1 helix-turn-helix transcriptional regulator [Clostridium botulinum]NFA43394.1 XRE family transcriptional regulator [Clostridium botulinum]NFO35117.1 helix-turn-helix transcriptional regulator [Clostridium botulinum]NFO48354.1 helix-turn-helix transcriptional regulator [Clostridium botulinum]